MKDLKDVNILYADFKDWLTHPLTKVFITALDQRKDEFINRASALASKDYHKKEINDTVTLLYGKADGINTILSMMEDCQEDDIAIAEIDNKKVSTYHTIHELLQQPFTI